MKTITSVAMAALMLGLAACSPAAETEADAAPAGAVTLTDRPNLTADVEAMPRLAGEGAAITAINADLDRLDALARDNAAACTGDVGEGVSANWNRFVTRPMTGPAYVTLREHSEWYCGGAYPDTNQTAVTWDLATGQRVDWAAALPGLNLTVAGLEDMPAGAVATVSSAVLGALYSRRVQANAAGETEWLEQCRDVLAPEALIEQSFNIWADAENGGVTVQPDFAHVIKACGESATLNAEELRGVGASPALLEAIAAAHAAGNWAPKEKAGPGA